MIYAVGLGLFQAIAIQFGLDQLLEAPRPKLIAFIHWYYWAALHRKQQVNNNIHGLFIDIDRQPAMPNSCNTNFAACAHHHGS